jgi:DNA polymerase-1
MTRRFKRTKCLCSKCPYEHKNRVWSAYDQTNPFVALLGEAPGADEDQAEKKASWQSDEDFKKQEKGPFVGPAGRMLKHAMAECGLQFHTTYRMNVICCRPLNNDIHSSDSIEAIKCCLPGFEEELAFLKKLGIKILSPLGNTAIDALHLEGNISKLRGSVFQHKDFIAVPTYHPSYILRGAQNEEPVWYADFRKIKELSTTAWKPPRELFNINPTVEQIEYFCSDAVKNDRLVAIDIETTGGLNPEFNKIMMIGMAIDGERALVVPFCENGKFDKWHNGNAVRVTKAVSSVLKKCRTMYHNAMFDVSQLECKGFSVDRITHDTMLLAHCIHPELPKNLGYVVSIYGKTPFWKDVVKGSKDRMIDQPDDVVRTYNARDSVVLHQILRPMLDDLKAVGTEESYKQEIRLLRPLIDMTARGILIDQDALKKKKVDLKKKCESLEKQIKKSLQLPDSFNLNSTEQVCYLLFGSIPKGYKKAKEEKEEIDANPKRSKDTKKYKELVEKCDNVEKVTPLIKTRSTATNTDVDAMISIKRSALNRLDAISGLKKKNEGHEKEKKELKKLIDFIDKWNEWGDAAKLLSMVNYTIGKDGRVHGKFNIAGTATGRLSASDPNLQQQPKEIRDVFIASPGMVLVQADYSNLELRVLAAISEETYLLNAFKSGLNIHDVNCKLLFGIDEKHPKWDMFRKAAKTFAFGRGYGGGLDGIYRRILAAIPGFDLSYSAFVEADRRYFSNLPMYAKWRDRLQNCVVGKRDECDDVGYRWVKNAFGRKRFLLGSLDEISREVLNSPIQGTAGDIANKTLCDVAECFSKHKELNAHCLVVVHDSLLVECPKEKLNEVVAIMKKKMECTFAIKGKKVIFPVDIEYGENWGKLEKWSDKEKGT